MAEETHDETHVAAVEALTVEALVVEALVDEAIGDYRIDRGSARKLVEEALRHEHKFRAAVAGESDLKRLRRTRAFRDARKKARKAIYYALRQYKRPSPSGVGLASLIRELEEADAAEKVELACREILAAHSSTLERLASREAFNEGLLEVVGRARTVLDVGSGVYPLMFPFAEHARGLELYLALDRDAEVIQALRAFATARPETRLVACKWDLAEGWEALSERFDVALMLKLVPVVARQQPELLDILARVPARRFVVSGSRVALARQTNIERRERAVLQRWIDRHGFEVVAELSVGEELVFVLEPRSS